MASQFYLLDSYMRYIDPQLSMRMQWYTTVLGI